MRWLALKYHRMGRSPLWSMKYEGHKHWYAPTLMEVYSPVKASGSQQNHEILRLHTHYKVNFHSIFKTCRGHRALDLSSHGSWAFLTLPALSTSTQASPPPPPPPHYRPRTLVGRACLLSATLPESRPGLQRVLKALQSAVARPETAAPDNRIPHKRRSISAVTLQRLLGEKMQAVKPFF